MNTPLDLLVAHVAQALLDKGWMLATAESCTGGLVAAHCTERAGSSAWFERGLVTYSNQAKMDLLGVPAPTLETHGAVSEPVAKAMALGALQRSKAQVAVAITGIAGPTGAVHGKPVGTVWLAWAVGCASGAEPLVHATLLHATGDRASVRGQAVHAALQGVLDRVLAA